MVKMRMEPWKTSVTMAAETPSGGPMSGHQEAQSKGSQENMVGGSIDKWCPTYSSHRLDLGPWACVRTQLDGTSPARANLAV